MTEEKLNELLKNVPRDEQGRIIGADMYAPADLAGPTGENGIQVLKEKECPTCELKEKCEQENINPLDPGCKMSKMIGTRVSSVPNKGRKCMECRWYTRWCSESGKHITRYCLANSDSRTKSGLKKVKGDDQACAGFCEHSYYSDYDY